MSFKYELKTIKTLSECNIKGKRVFCRVDFNVPMKNGVIEDDSRIRAALPTIEYCLSQGASLVLASHLGRPKGKPEEKYSLLPVAAHLAELLKKEVLFPDDCVGSGVKKLLMDSKTPFVMLLENLRFHAEEEKNDPDFARELQHGCDVYVDDAFGAIHRAHASVDALARLFDVRCAGLLIEKELKALQPLMDRPAKPYAVVLGGSKISDKLKVVENLLKKTDMLFLGGAMVFTFLKAEGMKIGKSLVEEDMLGRAARLLKDARERGVQVFFPQDFRVAPSIERASENYVSLGMNIPEGMMGLDVGPKTVEYFEEHLSKAKTVFWNGPLGLFETPPFDQGTTGVAKTLAALNALTILGGGDSVAAAKQAGLADRFSHQSTGGGATLEFIEGKVLPGLEALGA